MNATPGDLARLTGLPAAKAHVARPRVRWKTRVLVPLVVLLAAAGMLAYAARAALWPAVGVWVVPVVAAPAGEGEECEGGAGQTVVLAQAPGWVEADPYAVSVPALAEGVIRELLVLEGERVEAGQVVARMVDEEARLDLARAEAELAEREAGVQRARTAVLAAEARLSEVQDEIRRKKDLVSAGGVSEGQYARLEIRALGLQREVESASAEVVAVQAAVRTAQVAREQAALRLKRMAIRSPSDGVVMARLVEPGARLSMSGSDRGGLMGAVVRLYNPAKLQVRVDVPLADVARIGVGTPAQITTEALPDTTFTGAVTRVVHEANIQRNTVQVKVAIENPTEVLKPEMFMRVRFMGEGGSPVGQAAGGGGRLLASSAALLDVSGERARVWVVDHSSAAAGPVAALREVAIVPGSERAESGYAEIVQGLRPGDRLIVGPPAGLAPGARLRVLGERVGTGVPEGEAE